MWGGGAKLYILSHPHWCVSGWPEGAEHILKAEKNQQSGKDGAHFTPHMVYFMLNFRSGQWEFFLAVSVHM